MDKNLLDICIERQYELPRRLYEEAYRYPHVSFYLAIKFYEIAVTEVLLIYGAKHLYDTPLSFGRGLVFARRLWQEKMSYAEKALKN